MLFRSHINFKFSNGNKIMMTEDHEIFVVDKGWTAAKNVAVGDEVIQYDYPFFRRTIFGHNFWFQKGCSPWNKGLTKETDLRLAAASKKISHTLSGNTPWNKGLTKKDDPRIFRSALKVSNTVKQLRRNIESVYNSYEYKRKVVKGLKKSWSNDEQRHVNASKLMRLTARRNWSNPIIVKKHLQAIWEASRRRPTMPEKHLSYVLRNLCPGEFGYNGDFRLGVSIGKKVPDFVNVNGKKKLIEVFGNYWHQSQDPTRLITYYSGFGWDCLVIWENELKDLNCIRKKIKTFLYNPRIEIVQVVEVSRHEKEIPVYNIQTERNHNYFANELLVHNCGAGGGGFMLFFVKPKMRQRLIKKMVSSGLIHVPFAFEFDGVRVEARI